MTREVLWKFKIKRSKSRSAWHNVCKKSQNYQ